MNTRTLALWGIILVVLMQSACQNPTEPEQQQTTPTVTTVKGTVLRSDNLSPVPNVIVFDNGGLAKDTTKSGGDSTGTFRLKYQITGPYVSKIIATRLGFGNDTTTITVRPGIDTTITMTLKADSTSPSTGNLSGKASNIVLVGSSDLNISIRGTGLNETAVLTFEIRDSLGLAIGASNKVKVNFSILGGPGGGEYVFPASAETDPLSGRVTTRVTSGTKAGVLQVYASTTVGTNIIKSSPVRITIAGGLPVPERFSMSRSVGNIAGGVFDNLRARISVVVGDKEGNPVQVGTAIYFTTTGGIIQPSATTDVNGIASVDLITGNPRPANGIALVTAKTIGDSGLVISKTIPIVFSGRTTIIGPQSQVLIADSGSTQFNYIVRDPNGFPLVSSTNILVKAEGPGAADLELFGDVNRTLPDTDDPKFTLFTLKVRDKTRGGPAGPVTFKIDVKSQNGDATLDVSGVVLADTNQPPPPSTIDGGARTGYAANLTLVSISSNQLSVSGTGANETATLTFVAKDSLGRAVDPARRAFVTFSISPTGGLGGGEFVSPTGDSTNSVGQVSTTFNAGTRSGVVQIVARANVLGRVITSAPVKLTIAGGLPDSTRFTASLSKLNMPGLVVAGLLGTVKVQVGDKFGNPVQTGTALYFSTSGGLISPTAFTDNAGQASVALQGGNPAPNEPSLGGPGFGFVTIQTVGENGVSIRKQLPFLFSGAPVVSVLNVPADTVKLADGSSFEVDYRVSDANGNPISSGNRISVSVSGTGAAGVTMSGDIDVSMPDTQDRVNGTRFKFKVADNTPDGGPSGNLVFTIRVTGESGTSTRTFYGVLLPAQVDPGLQAGYAASLTLVSISSSQLSVTGTGATETSTLRFVAQDSLGRPVDQTRRALVTFSISPTGGLGGGEFVSPSADSTNKQGQVSTTFNAGTRSGVVQIVAQANVLGRIIKSSPVKLTIAGGLPDSTRFTASLSKLNMPGIVKAGVLGTVNVQVGDRFGNPVQTGTAIYFSTSGGLVAPTAFTDGSGQASVSLQGGNPVPNEPSLGGPGFGYVTIQTVGENGVSIRKQLPFLFSGAPVISVLNVPTDTLRLPDGASTDVDLRVSDLNGNPISNGNKVTVSVSGEAAGDIQLSADWSGILMPDTQDRVSGTRFRFRVADRVANGGLSGELLFTISVEGESGTLTRNFYGVLQSTQQVTIPPSATARQPAQIAFLGVTATDIFVAGVGALENSVITYEVRDSLGVPIDKLRRAYATFGLEFFPNSTVRGGTLPRLIPNADSTDDQGKLRVSVASGTQAGVVQVVSRITLATGVSIVSQPVKLTVHAGFPERGHFFFTTDGYAFASSGNSIGPNFFVQVGDTFSNPVAKGTAIYFSSQAGLIQTGQQDFVAYTDRNGRAAVQFLGGNPTPDAAGTTLAGRSTFYQRPGIFWVYAQTQGRDATTIIDSARVCWSINPVIYTGIPIATVAIPQGGTSAPISITVKDSRGNPLPVGTSISVAIKFVSDVTGIQFGSFGDLSTDDAFVMPNAPYVVDPGPLVTDFTFQISDLSTGGGAPLGLSIIVTVRVSAPGLGNSSRTFNGKIQ